MEARCPQSSTQDRPGYYAFALGACITTKILHGTGLKADWLKKARGDSLQSYLANNLP